MEEITKNLSHLMNYRKQVATEGFVELINKILAQLPGLGWQLGSDLADSELDRLSLSVAHVPQLLNDAAFVACFPIHGDGWVIDLGVPPREWEIYFKATLDGKVYEVEGQEWFWKMAQEKNMVRLLFAAPPEKFACLDKEVLKEFGEVIATGELGELNVMRFFASVGAMLTEGPGEDWLPMETLRTRFVERFPSCEYAAWLSAPRE